MTQDPEKMKMLIAFKKRLEEQLERLTTESKEIEATLDTVNGILLDKGFRRGDLKEIPATSEPQEVVLPNHEAETPTVTIQYAHEFQKEHAVQPSAEQESVLPLKTMSDEPLALIVFDKHGMHVLPDESKNFSVNTPPFNNFLVEKVFAKMREKDNELSKTKQLSPDKVFSYNVIREGEHIREIFIQNYDDERLKELKSSIRWTFEKMYEKMKGT